MDDTYMRKKHAKWIGRASQIQRLIKNKGMDDTRRDPQGHDLLCKLFTTAEIREGKVEALLQQRLKAKNELITKYENSLKQIRMANWKDRMQSSVAEVSKWIQRKSQPAMCLPAECYSRSEVTAEIRQFCEKEWNKPQEDPQSRQDRWNRFMLHPIGKLAARNNTIGERWQRPSDAAWHKAHRKASGSGGPDGTTGVEIHNLTSPVINLFRTFTETWERTKLAPTRMSWIRQAALQKPGKPNTIPNLRPIAVMSAWWRLYESAWVQSDSLVAWRRKIGRGHNVGHTESSELARPGRRVRGGHGFLQGVRPHGSRTVEASNDRSWLARKHRDPDGRRVEGTETHSLLWRAPRPHQPQDNVRASQGGLLGPTVCQLWLLGGAEWTDEQQHSRRTEGKATAATEPEQRKRRKPNCKREVDAVYMDDRSLVRGDARSLVASVMDWQAWSEGVQMQENWSKLQMMEEVKAQVEEAGRPQWAEHVTEEAEILGTALTRSDRIGTKQTKRMTKFTDRLAILQAIPFRTRTDSHIAVRTLANSVASYGWVTTAPWETLLNTAASKIWNSKRLGLKGAARHLKWMAEVARTHLMPVITSRLIGVVS